jgi:hypothetical protein
MMRLLAMNDDGDAISKQLKTIPKKLANEELYASGGDMNSHRRESM